MTGWLREGELRIGLGCMRLGADAAEATVATALELGVTVFDTARAYDGNERLLGRLLTGSQARVVTKGGMSRPDGAWVPDGRAASIRRDCEESLRALEGLPIDLYLLHAPDPRVPWETSLRALGRLLAEGLVRSVGVSNVNRDQLDAALDIVPVTAVEVALSRFDDTAVRGGVVRRCEERGITVLAHSPLGGPRRVRRDKGIEELAWVLGQSPAVVPIPGARTPEAVRSAVSALTRTATKTERVPAALRRNAEVRIVMGIPGAGKTSHAKGLSGFVRLNRDERGGSLEGIVSELDRVLAGGAERVVLDNTYLTRASRNRVIETAARHGVRASCTWVDTPVEQAQVNLVLRQLELLGRLPAPEELKDLAKRHPGVMLPGSHLRAARQLEPPTDDEGFAELTRVPFLRASTTGRSGVFVAADAWPPKEVTDEPHLVFGWQKRPEVDPAKAARRICDHPGGPPSCWCRPPLPGLVLEFCYERGVDPARSLLYGASSSDKRLAAALGARFVSVREDG